MVTLAGVNDGTSTRDYEIPLSILIGDSNGDRAVNSGDSIQCRSLSGRPADSTNFRSDFNGDGAINSGDSLITRSRSGTGL
jgi:hypothetical protein